MSAKQYDVSRVRPRSKGYRARTYVLLTDGEFRRVKLAALKANQPLIEFVADAVLAAADKK